MGWNLFGIPYLVASYDLNGIDLPHLLYSYDGQTYNTSSHGWAEPVAWATASLPKRLLSATGR